MKDIRQFIEAVKAAQAEEKLLPDDLYKGIVELLKQPAAEKFLVDTMAKSGLLPLGGREGVANMAALFIALGYWYRSEEPEKSAEEEVNALFKELNLKVKGEDIS